MINFKGHRFEKDIILLCVRWYLGYRLSYRYLDEMMEERSMRVDHTNILSGLIARIGYSNLPFKNSATQP